ncbi:MAG: hypothetical protein AB7S26_04280 [Sandaracinaceae bacterium]
MPTPTSSLLGSPHVRIGEAIGIAFLLQIVFMVLMVVIRESFGLQDTLPVWVGNGIAGAAFPVVVTALARRRAARAAGRPAIEGEVPPPE